MNGIQIYVSNDLNNKNIILNGTLLDISDKENIEMTLKQTDIRDISANYADFTKKFTIPASPTNRKILKYWHDIRNQNQWANDVEIPARIDIDGVLFRMGILKIENATIDDDNELKNYTVQFYANLKSLKDLYGDKLIGQLPYDEILFNDAEFEYTASKVLSLFHNGNVHGLAMPLASTKRLLNDFQAIKYTPGTPNPNGISKDELRPSLQCRQIMSAIEKEFDVKFIGDILDNQQSPLNKLHIWLNKNEQAYANGLTKIDLSGTAQTYTPNWGSNNLDVYFDVGRNIIKLNKRNMPGALTSMRFKLNVRTQVSNNQSPYKIFIQEVILNTDLTVNEQMTKTQENEGFLGSSTENAMTGNQDNAATYTWNLQNSAEPFNTVRYFRFWAEVSGTLSLTLVDLTVQHLLYSTAQLTTQNVIHRLQSTASNSLVAKFNVQKSLPDLSIHEFMSSLLKLFNLVIIPIYDPFLSQQYGTQNLFKLEYFNTYYGSTNTLDITKYTKLGVKIEKVPTYKKIEFKFNKSDFGTNKEFMAAQVPEREYGTLSNSFATGTNEFKIETKFGLLIWHELANIQYSGNPNLTQTWIIADALDEDYDGGVFNKPIIFFKSGLNAPIDQRYISLKNDSGGDMSLFRQFAMSNIDNLLAPSTTLTFSQEKMFGTTYQQTLYKNYYANLVSGVYSPFSRIYEVTAILPKNIYMYLSLGTTIIIQNVKYNITDITINLIDGEAKLKLNNVIDRAGIVEYQSIDNQRQASPPEFLTVERSGNAAKISWSGQDSSRGIIAYRIDVRIGDEKQEYFPLDTIKSDETEAEYIHEGIDENEIYTYKINVVDYSGKDGMALAIVSEP